MSTIPLDVHLTIGGLIFPDMDQCDFTGPFEALARVPNSTFKTIWKDKNPVRDLAGMQLLADTTIDEAPQFDVLLVPGGYGQEALMDDGNGPVVHPQAGRGARAMSSRSARARCCAARRACCRENALRRTGARWTCCRSSVRPQATNAS